MADSPHFNSNDEVVTYLDKLGFKQRFVYYFAQLASIPHGSYNTKQISDYCCRFAQEHGLRYDQDKWNNVVIYKPATPGYEDHPTVIFQGHLDMVAVKVPSCTLDMQNEGLRLNTDGEGLWADGTSLGADDGIAIAYALALLENNEIKHPNLEVLFTTEEEVGMDGAHNVNPDWFKGRILLNADSEIENLFIAGCSGGSKREMKLPVVREKASGALAELRVDGIQGGHSGIMITAGRANGGRILGELMDDLSKVCRLGLISCDGGEKDNAIPDLGIARVVIPVGELAAAKAAAAEYQEKARAFFGQRDPDLTVTVTELGTADDVMALDHKSLDNLTDLLHVLPNGVQAMMAAVPGLPETSINMGQFHLKAEDDFALIRVSARSALRKSLKELTDKVDQLAAQHGASSEPGGAYPPWEFRDVSPLRDVLSKVYEAQYGKPAKISAVHAGLECGILSEKLPGMDAISYGPDIADIHSPKERLNLPSAVRVWDFTLKLLEAL